MCPNSANRKGNSKGNLTALILSQLSYLFYLRRWRDVCSEGDQFQSLFTKYFLKGMSGEGDKNPYGNGDCYVSLIGTEEVSGWRDDLI